MDKNVKISLLRAACGATYVTTLLLLGNFVSGKLAIGMLLVSMVSAWIFFMSYFVFKRD